MITLLPENFECQTELRAEIERKIRDLQKVENIVPLVFIVIDIRSHSVVYMSERGLNYLGKDLEFVRSLGSDYYDFFFNPEDVEFYVPKFKEHLASPDNRERWFSFFQQVRTSAMGDYEWYLSAATPFVFDEDGLPILALTFATLLHEHHHLTEKVERLLEENLMLRSKQQHFLSLTKKEREVLCYISRGMAISEISKTLFSSELTIRTHRRNIKKKINARSEYEMIRFAQAFNLV